MDNQISNYERKNWYNLIEIEEVLEQLDAHDIQNFSNIPNSEIHFYFFIVVILIFFIILLILI